MPYAMQFPTHRVGGQVELCPIRDYAFSEVCGGVRLCLILRASPWECSSSRDAPKLHRVHFCGICRQVVLLTQSPMSTRWTYKRTWNLMENTNSQWKCRFALTSLILHYLLSKPTTVGLVNQDHNDRSGLVSFLVWSTSQVGNLDIEYPRTIIYLSAYSYKTNGTQHGAWILEPIWSQWISIELLFTWRAGRLPRSAECASHLESPLACLFVFILMGWHLRNHFHFQCHRYTVIRWNRQSNTSIHQVLRS